MTKTLPMNLEIFETAKYEISYFCQRHCHLNNVLNTFG